MKRILFYLLLLPLACHDKYDDVRSFGSEVNQHNPNDLQDLQTTEKILSQQWSQVDPSLSETFITGGNPLQDSFEAQALGNGNYRLTIRNYYKDAADPLTVSDHAIYKMDRQGALVKNGAEGKGPKKISVVKKDDAHMILRWENQNLEFFKKPHGIREFFYGWKFTGDEKTISKDMRVWRAPQVIKYKVIAGKDKDGKEVKEEEVRIINEGDNKNLYLAFLENANLNYQLGYLKLPSYDLKGHESEHMILFKEPKAQLNSSRNTITASSDRNQGTMTFYILDYDSYNGTLKTLTMLKEFNTVTYYKINWQREANK